MKKTLLAKRFRDRFIMTDYCRFYQYHRTHSNRYQLKLNALWSRQFDQARIGRGLTKPFYHIERFA